MSSKLVNRVLKDLRGNETLYYIIQVQNIVTVTFLYIQSAVQQIAIYNPQMECYDKELQGYVSCS